MRENFDWRTKITLYLSYSSSYSYTRVFSYLIHVAIASRGRMYGRMFIFVENFHVNNLSVVLEIFHVFNFRGARVATHENYLTSNISRFTVIEFQVSSMFWVHSLA